MSKTSLKHISEEITIRRALDISGKRAYLSTLKKGVEVSVLEGDQIKKVSPDGTKVVVGHIKITRKSPIAHRIRLK